MQNIEALHREIVDATISHNEYKDVLLNQKCLRNSMNRVKSKYHGIGTYQINTRYIS